MAIRPIDACPCGSGRKYKHCYSAKAGHIPQAEARLTALS